MNRFVAAFDCSRGPPWRLLAVVVVCVLGAGTVRADEITLEDGARFDVRSAFLESAEHVYQLRATLDLGLSRNAQQALREGVPIVLELDIRVDRRRRLLPDEGVALLVQRWQIHYHALSERYLVNNLNSGQQASFSNLASALAELSEVRGLPVIDEALIEPGQRYEASLKAVATIEGGLPNALRVMMFWIDWKRSTDWYTWTVRP
ncbi:MAG TPA: DUF4390 domain-containing protein [Steroidobacteraceae bacterium]|nr:DUF4390 domain-containing protein [Steroidobacteraceae bacterium]